MDAVILDMAEHIRMVWLLRGSSESASTGKENGGVSQSRQKRKRDSYGHNVSNARRAGTALRRA